MKYKMLVLDMDDTLLNDDHTISNENNLINASGLTYVSPKKPYWEYSAGVGNIFKVFRLDFSWRGK